MSLLLSMFYGFVQGVTEFLPVSSSGHLAIFQNIFGMENIAEGHLLFDVMLHFGTLIAVFIAFFKDIKNIFLEFFGLIASFFKKPAKSAPPPARRLVLMLIIATVPLLIILPFKSSIELLYQMPFYIGLALIFTGVILFLSDKMKKGSKDEKTASMANALFVGVTQALAVAPGLSRSGLTITGGLVSGFGRDFAVRFSFLLSIPAVLGATILELADALGEGIDVSLIPIYLVGVATAAVTGFFSIRLVRYLVNRGRFGGFAYYCLIAGAAVIIWSLFS